MYYELADLSMVQSEGCHSCVQRERCHIAHIEGRDGCGLYEMDDAVVHDKTAFMEMDVEQQDFLSFRQVR